MLNGLLALWGVDNMQVYQTVSFAVIVLSALTGSALAGFTPVPGPVAGIGLPALAVIGGAYWIGRKLLNRRGP
jgi:hypothetical protein